MSQANFPPTKQEADGAYVGDGGSNTVHTHVSAEVHTVTHHLRPRSYSRLKLLGKLWFGIGAPCCVVAMTRRNFGKLKVGIRGYMMNASFCAATCTTGGAPSRSSRRSGLPGSDLRRTQGSRIVCVEPSTHALAAGFFSRGSSTSAIYEFCV